MTVESATADLITGAFQPGLDFAAVEHLFRDFEEAVNSQALAAVETLDAAIATLGCCLVLPDGSECLAVHDLQIWSDGGFSCRPGTEACSPLNGAQAAQSSASALKQ
jgi:hypothetical protein